MVEQQYIVLLYNIMKVLSMLLGFSAIEIVLVLVFILYVVLPVPMPSQAAHYIDHPFGIVLVMLVALYLFFNAHPVVAVVYLLVAFELVRRASQMTHRVPLMEFNPSEKKKMQKMVEMNTPHHTTLEEEMVSQLPPAEQDFSLNLGQSSFKPVAEKMNGASLI
jgi:hypothetical protein